MPGFIKQQYKNRIAAIPPPASISSNGQTSGASLASLASKESSTKFTKTSDLSQDQQDWLTSLVSMQNSIVREQMTSEMKADKQGRKAKKVSKKKKKKMNRQASSDKKVNGTSVEAAEDSGNESTDSECSLGLDLEDGISVSAQAEIMSYLAKGSSLANVQGLDPSLRDFLAMKHIKQLFGEKRKIKAAQHQGPPELRSRAALVPIDLKVRQPFEMCYRTYTIGTGSTVDLDLSMLGKCHSVSDKHASIFFDQYSRVFELINYSEHGTIVDNIIYSGDVTLHPPPAKVSNKRLKTMAPPGDKDFACHCTKSAAEMNSPKGCEVSAVLKHGSYVRFGCFQFVFSIVNYGDEEPGDTESQTDVKNEPAPAKDTTENHEEKMEVDKAKKDASKSDSKTKE